MKIISVNLLPSSFTIQQWRTPTDRVLKGIASMSDVSAFLNFDIVDAYTEYKRRQKILTGWLVKNTDNDANAKYSLRQIEEMAEDAVSRQVAISSDILYLASSLVQLRREVGLHYQDGDTGHLKCIASLQTIVAYLKQLPVLRLPYTHERDLIDTSAQFCGTTNRFDLLRSLAKKQHIYVQPVLPSVSQVKSQVSENSAQPGQDQSNLKKEHRTNRQSCKRSQERSSESPSSTCKLP